MVGPLLIALLERNFMRAMYKRYLSLNYYVCLSDILDHNSTGMEMQLDLTTYATEADTCTFYTLE